jgi:hypothetical protein
MEYLCYRFRELIYQRPFDKKKFADICAKKKEKIDQIALENCIPTIFNNMVQREKYLQKFFKKDGMPSFCYRDEYQLKIKGHWDISYYYMIGTSVRVVINNEVEIGRIQECLIEDREVILKIESGVVRKNIDCVTRIFPSSFYIDLLSNSSV